MTDDLTLSNPERNPATPDGRSGEDQPRWRQDFPIDLSQYDYISRRDFIKFLILVSGAFTAGQFFLVLQSLSRSAEQLPTLEVADIDDIPIGGTYVFEYPPGSPSRILVRLSDDRFVAYEQQCTHLLCPVIPEPENNVIHCPCHEGYFDLESGRPIAGPPNRPLARVVLEIRDGKIFATDIERRTV
ncbi:MAG: ubiquinol-cytochrome c reductase iron-sulfur subunit [Anaerolineae bacterium]|nr:ubiquinol-cytochrome c reductase iron-sulfur subunit [Anaerolineae bacterium]NUQ05779.1 ubiquinol-cytochrome c reductase iron-sulfur subunit [Anaerolineae bacterium]